jgi:hypothetical protein
MEDSSRVVLAAAKAESDIDSAIDDIVPGSGRVFCANCIHCKLVPAPEDAEGSYRLRVRCEEGKWRKKLGEEKIYKYFTVARRSIESCDSYEDMGDAAEFIKDLRKLLPTSDELYSS